MAVEAQHMNFFSPQQLLTTDRDLMKTNINPYITSQPEYAIPAMPDQHNHLLLHQPFYHQQVCDQKTSLNKSDSGLTYNVNINNNNNNNNIVSRKRVRDCINDNYNINTSSQKQRLSSGFDGDVMFQLQQQQSDINSLIADHTQKIRLELEQRSRTQLRSLLTTIQDEVGKKLKEKDDEILRMGKMNLVLQERVKSLYVENQIWRDLAQTNEATANSLRSNLEQVLAHVSIDDHRHVTGGGNAAADDAESSCGSSDSGREKETEVFQDGWRSRRSTTAVGGGGRNCRNCGEKESSVLLLPCRHLCLCTNCGSNLVVNCPVCNSVTNASVHVNMSS
ncbi:BOI-related E3 ubiquitin-protein ligase 1-like [Rutidosis leptorrhynchoides]|uniref:BOI-related E3 ubiquitin-protein ligase 1-like n=1 Tax=Rutidosis leptorrhynchoides TaxID=125765 RepID=UPI003A98F32A